MEKGACKVSVIIPTFQRSTYYLERAINSVLKQTFENIEIVIIDDNCPESFERKVVETFMEQYAKEEKIIYVKNEVNLGGALARNIGIQKATGDYITFLDDDDEYLPSKIEKQVAYMIEFGYDMTFTDLILVNEKKKVIDYREYKELKSFDKKSLLKFHILKHLTGTPTFMYRSEALKKIGGFDKVKMGQEFYLMLKTIEHSLQIGYLPECAVIAYRHNEGGISYGKNKIEGEIALYNFKQRYKKDFSPRELSYIDFRHNMVMVVAFLRNKQQGVAFLYLLKVIFFTPVLFIQELYSFAKKILRIKMGELK